jgi:hypothetical protein
LYSLALAEETMTLPSPTMSLSLRTLQMQLLVLVDFVSAYATEFVPNAIDGFNGDPLDGNGIEKPKDVFYIYTNTPINSSLSTELVQDKF